MSEPKLLDRVRSVVRPRHLGLSTGKTYPDWIRRYILFHRKRHPKWMGAEEIRQFLLRKCFAWGIDFSQSVKDAPRPAPPRLKNIDKLEVTAL